MNFEQINKQMLLHIQSCLDLPESDSFSTQRKNCGSVEIESEDKSSGEQNDDPFCIAHSHPFKELLFDLKGTVCVEMDGRVSRLQPDEMGYISAGVFHKVLIANPSEEHLILWASVDVNRLRLHLSSYFNQKVNIIDGIDIPIEGYLLDKVDDELLYKKADYLRYSNVYLQAFWRTVLRNYEKSCETSSTGDAWKNRIASEVDEYLFNNINEKITLKEISNFVNVSPNYLSQLFKEAKGVNLFDYLQAKKIEYAKTLLKSRDKNISEVAYATGFSDPLYFAKVFKKAVGVSPKQYRDTL